MKQSLLSWIKEKRMNDYHKMTGYVSNSSLNVLENSPRRFKRFINGELVEEPTSYFTFGEAVHMYLLEPERFKKDVMVLEYTVPKTSQQKGFIEKFVELRENKVKTKEALKQAFESYYKPNKNWEARATEIFNNFKPYIKYLKYVKNKLIISPKIEEKIKSIAEEVKGHQIASKLLLDPSIVADNTLRFNELVILWEWKGIPCKSMIDRLLIDKEKKLISVVDIKTTSNFMDFKSSIDKYHYDRQLIFYSWAVYHDIEKIAGITKEELEEYDIEFIIVAIDKNSTEIRVFKYTNPTISKASEEIKSLLERAKWHIDNDKFDYPMEYYKTGGYELV